MPGHLAGPAVWAPIALEGMTHTAVVGSGFGLSRNDVYRFQNLRPGDVVRLYGVFVTNTRVELRQFY